MKCQCLQSASVNRSGEILSSFVQSVFMLISLPTGMLYLYTHTLTHMLQGSTVQRPPYRNSIWNKDNINMAVNKYHVISLLTTSSGVPIFTVSLIKTSSSFLAQTLLFLCVSPPKASPARTSPSSLLPPIYCLPLFHTKIHATDCTNSFSVSTYVLCISACIYSIRVCLYTF